MFFANVLAQNARKGAVGTGMRMFLSKDSFGRSAGRVVVNGNPWLLEGEGDVRLGHAEDGHGSKRMVFDEEVKESVHGILVPHFCDVSQRLALQRKQLWIVDYADEDSFRARNFLPFVVPLVGRSEHVFADASAHRWIFQALEELGVAAVVGPRGNESGKIVEPGGVGVSVSGDVNSLSPGGIHLCDGFGHVAPTRFATHFEMPDFDGDVSFAADTHGLVDGGQNTGAFITHMGSVDATEFRGFGGEGDQLFGFCVGSGSVLERSGNADGAIAHGLADEFFHLFELRGGGLHVIIAEHHAPHARGAHVAGEIDSHALLLDAGKILAKGPPVGLNMILVVVLLIGAKNGVVQGSDRFTFAGDFRGDALIDLGGQAWIDKDGALRLTEHVDEAGGNNFSARIDGASAGRGAEIADGVDLAAKNADIAGIPGRAGAVDDVAVDDDDVEGTSLPLRPEWSDDEEQNDKRERQHISLKTRILHWLILKPVAGPFVSESERWEPSYAGSA